jgi:ADP-ribose pyrophosphatase
MFRIVRATLRYRRFDGRMSAPVARINFERGASVGVLLYDPAESTVILVRQFRYPVYAGLEPQARAGDGARRAWLLEIVAGVQGEGESIEAVAHSELLEEAGFQLRGALQPMTTIYPSPGGTSERIHLFLAEVDGSERCSPGGGVASEGEDTQVVVLPLEAALEMVTRGEIQDAKTVVALQYLALLRCVHGGGVET